MESPDEEVCQPPLMWVRAEKDNLLLTKDTLLGAEAQVCEGDPMCPTLLMTHTGVRKMQCDNSSRFFLTVFNLENCVQEIHC